MKTIGRTIRHGLPALGLGLIGTFGGVVGMTAAALVATAPAQAQQTSAAFGKPYAEATTAVKSKDWATALAKANEAAPNAKSPKEKLAVENIKLAVAAGKGDKKGQIASLEALNGMGLDAASVRRNKETLAGLYSQTGDKAKATALTKEIVAAGGGSSQQLAFLASNALGAKDYAGAVSYAQKAIDASRKAGARPDEKMYNIIMKAFYDQGKMTEYYDVLVKAAADYPKPQYIKAVIDRAEKAPKYDRNTFTLDQMRAYEFASIPQADKDRLLMAEQALTRGMDAEALAIAKPLFDGGKFGGATDKNLTRNANLYKRIQTDAAAAKAGGLAKDEAAAAAAPNGLALIKVGERYIGAGDAAKGATLIQAGITKGNLKPEEIAAAQFHLGYAQFKAGKKEDARKTWSAIKAENGAQELAQAWTILSRK